MTRGRGAPGQVALNRERPEAAEKCRGLRLALSWWGGRLFGPVARTTVEWYARPNGGPGRFFEGAAPGCHILRTFMRGSLADFSENIGVSLMVFSTEIISQRLRIKGV